MNLNIKEDQQNISEPPRFASEKYIDSVIDMKGKKDKTPSSSTQLTESIDFPVATILKEV